MNERYITESSNGEQSLAEWLNILDIKYPNSIVINIREESNEEPDEIYGCPVSWTFYTITLDTNPPNR